MSSRWIPLESNPEVLNSWANAAGLVASQAQFGDVYGLDQELLEMVPQPVKAIVLLFPITSKYEAQRKEEDDKIARTGQPLIDPTVLWIKQTISNACGTIGIIHALANSNVTLVPGSPLTRFIQECQDKTPFERAHILETTPHFAEIHANAAAAGQTAVPEDLDTDLHFTCFVQAPDSNARETKTTAEMMRLIELDGRRNGPIDRGKCDNLLVDAAKFIRNAYVANSSSMHFSMMYLGPPA